MYLKQILLFLVLVVIGNQSKAQTLYFDANIEYLSCNCKGSTNSSPICGEDWLDKSISRNEQLEPCIFIKNIKEDYKRYYIKTTTFHIQTR